jgi:hypothetical protein
MGRELPASFAHVRLVPDTVLRPYIDPAEYTDSDHPALRDFAIAAVLPDASDREKASLLSKAVRDGICCR